ncbi:hypothetical protein LOK49_LG13G01250 [Camellia lanceoleosa]|uniref:Uncharacterized protein n=1 Tax=Camellia lanceoleosa TaxID=1840588 RepID=A0ACC0FK32_9ERIC|nr:hypothetical protein LOK49_LG13G01250 [Camellia lanceoleosa]
MDINSVSNPNMGDATGDINSQNLEGSQNVKTLECESSASKQEQMCFSENSVKKAVILRLTPDALPPGWIKEIRIQRKANKTRRDRKLEFMSSILLVLSEFETIFES